MLSIAGSMRIAAAVAAGWCAYATSVSASGVVLRRAASVSVVRTGTRDTFGTDLDHPRLELPACRGPVQEQLWESGDAHGFSDSLVLACVRGPAGGTASWVLISGTSCYDPAERAILCDTRRARQLPRLYEGGGGTLFSKSPRAMRYHLIRWGLGTNCAAHAGEGGDWSYGFWICDKVETKDGTFDELTRAGNLPLTREGQRQPLQPRNFFTTTIATNSKQPFREEDRPLPTTFASRDCDQYEYDFR